MKKIIFIFSLLGLFFGLAGFSFAQNATSGVSLWSTKDSDYDGLIDWVEIERFKTNPLLADTDGDGYLDSSEIILKSDPFDPEDPAKYVVAPDSTSTPKQKIIPWPWYIGRAAGITAFILMTLVIFIGTGITTGFLLKKLHPDKAWTIHRYFSIALAVFVFVHAFSFLFDEFIGFNLADVLIPFVSSFKPLYLGLGILGFYVFIAVILTSLLVMTKVPRLWRALHYLPYLMFVLVIIHAIFTGTDTKLPLMQGIYWVTGIISGILILYRLWWSFSRRRKA